MDRGGYALPSRDFSTADERALIGLLQHPLPATRPTFERRDAVSADRGGRMPDTHWWRDSTEQGVEDQAKPGLPVTRPVIVDPFPTCSSKPKIVGSTRRCRSDGPSNATLRWKPWVAGATRRVPLVRAVVQTSP